MMHPASVSLRKITGYLGIAAVAVLCLTLIVFIRLNTEFDLVDDYVSRLGAKNQPFALWWNLFGFALVGILFATFGWFYGRIVQDPFVRFFLALFGIGYAATAIPVDLMDKASTMSKAHTVAICLGVAGWMFGLARLSGSNVLEKRVKTTANYAAVLLLLPIAGFLIGFYSMPVTHKLVFATVLGWTLVTSIRLVSESSTQTSVKHT